MGAHAQDSIQACEEVVDVGELYISDGLISDPLGKQGALKNTKNEEDILKLQEWNSLVPERVERCVHEVIRERCRAQPDAPAVCAWDGDLTYGELDELSSALAVHLADLGVGPEVFVPVCLEKTRWTIVALVGVMKAGGAFVLLDPSHPVARLQAICRALSAHLIVVSEQSAALARELGCAKVVVMKDGAVWERDRDQLLGPVCTPDNAAYLVFTSGSTGAPKGVIIPHGAFSTSALAHGRMLRLDHRSRVLQFSSHAFDMSLFEMLTTLFMGGCVCVPSDLERTQDLALAITRLQVNYAMLTPSVLNILQPHHVPTLTAVAVGGERVSSTVLARWTSYVRIAQVYGPTECSVLSSAKREVAVGSDPSIIGRGMGCVCWVVDLADPETLMPIGAVGELLLEGPIVGRGYLNDPERTAAAFIDLPTWLRAFRTSFPGNPGGDRVYKTGDLVRYTADGSLQFIGRKDTQVKLRGLRIELGEVEHHVQRCFQGARTVVVEVITPVQAGRQPMLVAFIWPETESLSPAHQATDDGRVENEILAAPTEAFRAAIPGTRERLHAVVPAYMVPAVFLPLVAVPVTGTGKTNRNRLRDAVTALSLSDIEAYTSLSAVPKRSPTTAAERTMQQLWADTLNLAVALIGVDDNFFALGGDSITAMKLAGAARESGLSLTVSDIFQYPTLSEQALTMSRVSPGFTVPVEPPRFALLDVCDPERFVDDLVARHPSWSRRDIVDVIPTTEIQEEFVLTNLLSYCVFHIPGPVDLDRLQNAYQALADRYPILRSVFFPSPQGVVQAIVRWTPPAIARHYSDGDIREFSTTLCHRDSTVPLPFGAMPFQMSLVSARQAHEHILVLRLSHGQFDGVCLPTLYDDLAAAYRGESLSKTPSFSLYMQYRLSCKSTEAFRVWRDLLHGATMTQVDYAAIGGADSANETVISAAQTLPLSSPPPGITMATVVKAAWSLVLARLTGKADLVYGQTVNGRSLPVPEVEKILGPCVNVIPVRVSFQPAWTVRDLLDSMQSQYTRLLPFESLDVRDIVSQSTTGLGFTQFESIVQHNNIPTNPPVWLGSVECTSSCVAFPSGGERFYILSEPSGDDLKLSFAASSKMVNSIFAGRILDDICEAVLSFVHDPSQLLSL